MAHEILQEYDSAVAKVEAASEAIASRRAAEISCQSGCDSCCVGGLTVLSVEAFSIQEYLDEADETMPPLRGGDACAFLSDAGQCTIYPARPLLCRTHGLPIRMKTETEVAPDADMRNSALGDGNQRSGPRRTLQVLQDVEVCHLNFQNESPLPEDVLDAERISALLLVIEQRFRERAGLPDAFERIALADLCP